MRSRESTVVALELGEERAQLLRSVDPPIVSSDRDIVGCRVASIGEQLAQRHVGPLDGLSSPDGRARHRDDGVGTDVVAVEDET